jgi:hypothetical protein
VAKDGVTYEAARFQGVLVSRVHGLVDPLVTGEFPGSGVSIAAKCRGCGSRPRCAQENKHVVVARVPEMDNSFSRFALESRNVRTMVCSGLVRGGRVFGFVAADFCDGRLSDEAAADAVAEKVCRSAVKVQYFFQNRKVSDEGLADR